MISIIILGAGRSTSSLIEYLATHSDHNKWTLTVVDIDKETIHRKCDRYSNVNGVADDLRKSDILEKWISSGDVIVSMLPAFMHPIVAAACLKYDKHMVTASYAGSEMKSLDSLAKEKDLIFMNECGVDPGIDHMSTMEIIERLRDDNSEILSYESFTGGILAPESAKTLWNYKFTWNPRNVVLAGAGSAVKFIQEGLYKFIPYNKLFRRTEFIKIPGYGRFEGYANRDSLKYISEYGLNGIPTMYRGTLRRPGFCRAWDVFVKLGATDDSYEMDNVLGMTHRSFINCFLAYHKTDSVELKLMHYLQIPQDSEIMNMLNDINILSDEKVGLERGTPAQILQHMLEKKWTMGKGDVDMLVMWHRIYFKKDNTKYRLESSMVVKGKTIEDTAMAFTVGLPVGIATRLVALDKIKSRGVLLPMRKELYQPILKELSEWGIRFDERVTEVES
ncbi:MAG: Uncharacterised protein [Owenweeksia sp. TMED14]|nr:MAG: Uncharacterised protein [Owenweeksia sp. TMED14]